MEAAENRVCFCNAFHMGQSSHVRHADAHMFAMYIAGARRSVCDISRVNAGDADVGMERYAVESSSAVQTDGLPSVQILSDAIPGMLSDQLVPRSARSVEPLHRTSFAPSCVARRWSSGSRYWPRGQELCIRSSHAVADSRWPETESTAAVVVGWCDNACSSFAMEC